MACDNQPQNTEHNKQQKNHQRGAASIFGQAASQRELRRRSGVGKPKNQMSGGVQRVQRLRSWLTGLFMALPRPWELSIVGIQQDLLAHQFSAPKALESLAKVVYTSASTWEQEQMLQLCKSLMMGLDTKKAKIWSFHVSLCISKTCGRISCVLKQQCHN